VVNLDPRNAQSGWTDLDLEALGLEADERFEVNDLLSGTRYAWQGTRNSVRLDPQVAPAHILSLRPTRPEREVA
jgi:starch synthase (maltosyl-transferring)